MLSNQSFLSNEGGILHPNFALVGYKKQTKQKDKGFLWTLLRTNKNMIIFIIIMCQMGSFSKHRGYLNINISILQKN